MIPTLMVIAALMMVIEKRWPGQALPASGGWWLRIALVNLAQLGIVILAGQTWDHWLSASSLFHLSARWGDLRAALMAYFVSTFVYYWWHRVRHESRFFWRLCHQFHHSPRRIELLASFYKHPVEILLNSLISAALVYSLLGCSVRAAAIYTGLTAVAEYFYHWNIRTPRWIGALIQRPESHRVHHQFQHHTQNYADLPLWDWMFGTLHNPKTSPALCGFDERREKRVLEMLAFRDVHRVPESLPLTCFGCSKRWACAQSKAANPQAKA
ncbi:MAG: sterol desaturase family protein [Verrucomicrobiota bacterium]